MKVHKWADIKAKHFSPEQLARMEAEVKEEMPNIHEYSEACRCITCKAFRQAADEDLMKALEEAAKK